MKGKFTGWHMTAILVGGFGVVVAVNFLMATLAIRGFGGVVVENSYVASQKFNGWIAEERKEQALGWNARIARDDQGRISAVTDGVPASAKVSAAIRRPLGSAEHAEITLSQIAPGRFVSDSPLAAGRWIIRLNITDAGRDWSMEEHIG